MNRVKTVAVMGCIALLAVGCAKEEEKKAEASTAVNVNPPVMMPQAPTFDLSQVNKKPTDVMVEVNGKAFTRGEMDQRVMQVLLSQGVPPQMIDSVRPQAERQVIRAYVDRTVLLSDAQERKITVTEEELTKIIEELKGQVPADQNLEDLLKRSGVSMDQFHKSISEDIQIKKLIDVITKETVKVTEEEIKAMYEQMKPQMSVPDSVQARHVLVKFDEGADEAAKVEKKKVIDGLRKQVADGTEFAEVAKASSDCPSGKRAGGDLGKFGRGSMVKQFEDAAFSQKVNELGPVFETRFGYHFVEVLSREEAHTKTFEDVREEITVRLDRQKKEGAARIYVDGLREKATVKYEQDLGEKKTVVVPAKG